MTPTLYPFQRRDVDDLAKHNYTGLLAYEAGAGKTFTAIAAMIESGAKTVLILAPKSTHHSAWIPSLAKFGIEGRVIGNGNKDQKRALFDLELGYEGVYITTPQFAARADTAEWAGDMILADEVHQMVTMKSKIQRVLSGYSAHDGEPLNRRFLMRLALSGTPVRQDISNAWGLVRFLWPELDGWGELADYNAYRWMKERLEAQEVYTNQRDRDGKPKKVTQFTGEKEPGRLFREMPAVYIHKRRQRCCADHPNGFLTVDEPQVIERIVELTPAQKKNIREMEKMMFTYLADNPLEASIPLTQKQRIRQMTLGEGTARSFVVETDDGPVEKTTLEFSEDCKSPFLDETLHILGNLPEGENVVCYLESQKFAEVTVARLNAAGYKAAEYSGKRKADLNRFGKDFNILVGVISAIGTGTAGLNHVSSTEIFLEQPISLTNLSQTQARLERVDNTRQVQRFTLLDSEGVQEGRVDDLVLKRALIERTVRGRV